MNEITKALLSLKDDEYKKFQSALIPSVPEKRIIGVRTPLLRRLAKKMAGTDAAKAFMSELPHSYYDENNVHAFMLERITDFDECVAELERFLPYVDNWATCDVMSPSVFKKAPERLLPKIYEWISSGHTYTVRYGIGMLMRYFLDEKFLPEYLDTVAKIRSEEYYIRMMVAWYFATALAKQYNAAVAYIEGRVLDRWTHRKAIQKAVESYRISPDKKAYLKTLK